MLSNGLAQPFFLSVGFFETHREFMKPSSPWDAKYASPPAPLPDTPETRRDMGAFKASAWDLDWGIGEVLDALDAGGLADNTLVICTTDHGIAFPRMKGYLTDHGIGVMLILRGPGGFTGGPRFLAPVSPNDIFPPIFDLLENYRPRWLPGTASSSLVTGAVGPLHAPCFLGGTY